MKLPFRRKATTGTQAVVIPYGPPGSLMLWAPTPLIRFPEAWFMPQSVYLAQPNVRTVISFLARNIAQLGLHVFERVSDTERRRLNDHPLAQLIARPNGYTTRYRLIDSLVHDLAIFDNAYWAKIRDGDNLALLRLPPQTVSIVGNSPLRAEAFRLTGSAGVRDLPAETVVHFRGYNPDDARIGASPMRTLQSILLEDQAAADYRERFWRNAARMEGVISRPADAPDWSQPVRERFREEWEALYSGKGGSGKTAILEEGMTFSPAGFSARDSEYIAARKLSREEVAAAYHVAPPMVGILEHATFSNITEQHKMLYQDTLGPWLSMIEEELELQLLPEFAGVDNVYVEFNLAEKLKGSFAEEAAALQTATGAPWMTRAEARARQNLPPVDGADELVVPLNVLVGGQASPTDSAPPASGGAAATPLHLVGAKAGASREGHVRKHDEVLRRHFGRQRRVVVGALGAGKPLDDAYDPARWDRELHRDLLGLAMNLTGDVGHETAAKVDGTFDLDRTLAWLDDNARHAAETINATLLARLQDAVAGKQRKAAGDDTVDEEDPATLADDLFSIYAGSQSRQIAQTRVTAVAGFAFHEAADQNGIREKQWVVTSARSRHPRLNGERVPLGETFSNGLRWPGDGSTGDVNEVAGCTCILDL